MEFRIADAKKHPIVFLKKKDSVVAKTRSASLTLSPIARAILDVSQERFEPSPNGDISR